MGDRASTVGMKTNDRRRNRCWSSMAILGLPLWTAHQIRAAPPSSTAPVTSAPLTNLPSIEPAPELVPVAPGQPATTPNPATLPATVPSILAATQPATTPQPPAIALNKVVVSSELDIAREQIAPSLGAISYSITPEQLQAIPGGENTSFQQVLLRAPGVVADSFGQIHVRGEHGNLLYRVNGILLPQPLSGFGQEIDSHIIQSTTLITGSLPAQFGFHTAGIVDVTTKSGATLKANELSLYGGSHQTLQSSLVTGGTADRLDYFINATTNYNALGIENPTSSHDAIHDDANQQRLFGYFNYTLDDTSRLSLFINSANGDFEIPNTAGLSAAFPLAGHDFRTANSKTIDETQNEQKYYTVLAYQKSFERFNFQISAFSTYDQIHFQPDIANDLMFQGVAGNVYNNAVTNGLQFDSAYMLAKDHTLRGGFLFDYTQEKLNTNTQVFHTNLNGDPASDAPFTIGDNSGNHATEAGVYLQDEWKIAPVLTLNYGLRYDHYNAGFDDEGQLSPRINLVWDIDKQTTAHIGYSCYFVTPPPQNLTIAQVAPFNGTTNAGSANGPNGTLVADGVKCERSNYFDAGISHQITKPWSVTLDGFYKQAHNLIDEGQFGAPVIESPFNYQTGHVYGAELSSTYTQNGLSLYGNFSWVETEAHDINSQQYLIDTDEFAYIKNNDIHLDHQSEFAASAGISYTFNKNHDMAYIDFIYENGLRSGFANTGKQPEYYPVNIGYQHKFDLNAASLSGAGKQSLTLRFDIVNLFDDSYEIRDGSGIGVAAPQWGARRGFFVGLAYDF